MRVNIVGNSQEDKGLAADARVIRYVLNEHDVTDVNHQSHTAPKADLNIFLEVCRPKLHEYATSNTLVPNVEWWYSQPHGCYAAHEETDYDAIFTKTLHATEVLKHRNPTYTGFTTEDVKSDVKRERRFLHVAGASRYRNTDAVVEAWQKFYRKGGPEITVIASNLPEQKAPGLTWVPRIEDRSEYLEAANACLFHLLPSQYEGYGVALWEARCMGNVVVTTDYPPMNEGPAFTFVDPYEEIPRSMSPVMWATVTPEDVWKAVTRAWLAPESDLRKAQRAARKAWEREDKQFRKRFRGAVENVINERMAA